ncbi:MAG: EAL domain-containing protein [Azonexus sp.]|jgi:diguanylate cyclase (GGDEF)-like protein/PAS domain S-box-containing protein|nr:EAL domain-containing protein [Azonexus sp.]
MKCCFSGLRLGLGFLGAAQLAQAGLAWLYLDDRLVATILTVFAALSLVAAYRLYRRFQQNASLAAAQESRYQAIFRNMTDAILLYQPTADGEEFTIVDMNPAAERITQVSREMAVGGLSRQIFPGLESSGMFGVLRRVAASGQSEATKQCAYRDQRLDLWLERDVVRLPDGAVLSVFQDISAKKKAEGELFESLDNLREAQRIARIGNWVRDLRDDRRQWSKEMFRILELDPKRQAASDSAYIAAVHPDDREMIRASYEESLRLHRHSDIPHRLLFADGRVKYVYSHGETVFADDGAPLVSRGTLQDITERHLAVEALKLHRRIFEHSGEAIMVTDHDNRIIDVNPAFVRQTGYPLSQVVGQSPSILSSGQTPTATYAELWTALHEKGYWQGELWDRHRDDHTYVKWASISVIRDEHGAITHYIASFTDITERKAAEERIEHLVHHDSLTGLFNRHNLETRLAQSLLLAHRSSHRVAVLFIDLDRFKEINDRFGHPVGDQLLIQVAQRLKNCVRESDIIARQGGDEFVVVLNRLQTPDDASVIAAKILNALAQPYDIGEDRLHTSGSVGIATFPDDGEDAGTLMKHADVAMYYAKKQGRNNLQCFTSQLNAAAHERLRVEHELRRAIEHKQFELYYQPQFAADGDFCQPEAVEALIRWRHPERGLTLPDQFISIAEESGLIQLIGDWALNEACRQLADWKREGVAPQRVAVNISANQLRSAHLVERIGDVLRHYRLGRHELELEITETVAMNDLGYASERLNALRDLGALITIDDFGTGYSSLAYLKSLPIQTLKLDRIFVRDIETDANDAAISIATLALAHSLGLRVVAEGVESESQSRFLRAHGCDLLQGYLYGHPEPAATLTARWREASSDGS